MSEDAITPTPAAETPAESTPAEPAFSATYDRDALISNAPEGVDREAFGKYLDKTSDAYAGFKSYSNIEKMKSKGLPNAAWTDEDHAALDGARGVHTEAASYVFGEDSKLDDDSKSFMQGISVEGKFTPAQHDFVSGKLEQIRAAEVQAKEEAVQKGTDNMIDFLHSEWGHPDTPSYGNNFKLVQGVAETELGIKPGSAESDALWSGDPKVISLIQKYSEMLDGSVIDKIGAGDTTTPNSLQEKLNSLSHEMNTISDRSSKKYKELDTSFDRIHAQLARAESSRR